MANISPVKAIKIKDVVGNPKGAINKAIKAGTITTDREGVPEDGQTVILGYFYGMATGAEQHTRRVPQPDGSVKEESWPCIVGDFECVNLDDEGARAPKAFLAEHLCHAIGKACEEARQGDASAVIQLAFEIQAVTSSRGTAGFEWRMFTRSELVPQNDPVAKMRAIAQGKAPDALQLQQPKDQPLTPDVSEGAADTEAGSTQAESLAGGHRKPSNKGK